MNFDLEYVGGEKDKTFSPEGIINLFMAIQDYYGKFMTKAILKGFKEKKPVQKIEIDIGFKINGKKLSQKECDEIMAMYPECLGISRQALIDMMQEKDDR